MIPLLFIPLLIKAAWSPFFIPVVMVLALMVLTAPYLMWLRFVRSVRRAILESKEVLSGKNVHTANKTPQENGGLNRSYAFASSLRSGSKSVRLVRRAIVVVGGDFARSPRMQYHAVSLSEAIVRAPDSPSGANKKLKLFDEVVLLGYNCGNKLSEEVQKRTPFHSCNDARNDALRCDSLLSPIVYDGLFAPPLPPSWLTNTFAKVGGRKGAWAAGAIYKVLGLTVTLLIKLPRLLLPSVRTAAVADGSEVVIDILIPQLVLCQTPPALPFVPLIKLVTGTLSVIPDVDGRWLKLLQMELGSEGAPTRGGKKLSSANQSSTSLATALPMWLTGFTRPSLVVDWHNFGYTIMACDGRPAPMVGIYRAVERWCCRGHLNLTVSGAMKQALTEGANKKGGRSSGTSHKMVVVQEDDKRSPLATEASTKTSTSVQKTLSPKIIPFGFPDESVIILHDHSPRFFKPIGPQAFMDTVLPAFDDKQSVALSPPPSWVKSMLTQKAAQDTNATSNNSENKSGVEGRILVASTSWTADDDYTIVIDALKAIDASLCQYNRDPPNDKGNKRYLWFVATGKGIARPKFEQQVKEANFSPYVTVSAIYFQSLATYAAMIGGADAGLSLHYSSSGLDLPMKCVDMLGAGIPVFSLRYPAIHELVDEEGRSGWLFSNSKELAQFVLEGLLGVSENSSWSQSESLLSTKRAFIADNHSLKWDEDWDAVVLPAIQRLVLRRK